MIIHINDLSEYIYIYFHKSKYYIISFTGANVSTGIYYSFLKHSCLFDNYKLTLHVLRNFKLICLQAFKFVLL